MKHSFILVLLPLIQRIKVSRLRYIYEHPILTTTLLAASIHLLVLLSSPITASGGDENYYIAYGLGQARYGVLDPFPTTYDYNLNKTAGYPAIIALSFHLFGDSVLSIVLIQHLLYLMAQVCVVGLVNSWAGKWPALLCGIFLSLDPTIQLLSQWTMADTPSGVIVTLTWLAAVNHSRRASFLSALLLGLCLSFSTLIRPASAATLLPTLVFTLLYWRLEDRMTRVRVTSLMIVIALTIGTMMCWATYNKIRKDYFVMTDNVAWGFLDGLTQTAVFDKDVPAFAPYKAKYEQIASVPYTRYGDKIRDLVFLDVTRNYTSYPPKINEIVDKTLWRIAYQSVAAHPSQYAKTVFVTLWDYLLLWDRYGSSPLPRFTPTLRISALGSPPVRGPLKDLTTIQAQTNEVKARTSSAEEALRGGLIFRMYYAVSDRLSFLTRRLIISIALLGWIVLLIKRRWLPAMGFGSVFILAVSYSVLLMLQDRYIRGYAPIFYATATLGIHTLVASVRAPAVILRCVGVGNKR